MRSRCGLTDKEKEIIDFIKGFILENGYPPTTREIGSGVGIKSPSTINFYLKRLKEIGQIDYIESSPRTITLVGYKVELVPNLPECE